VEKADQQIDCHYQQQIGQYHQKAVANSNQRPFWRDKIGNRQLRAGIIVGAKNDLGCGRISDYQISAFGKTGFLYLQGRDMGLQKGDELLLLRFIFSDLVFI
jgi:hypothetical protein